MIRTLRLLCTIFFVVVIALASVSLALCADETGRYIKFVEAKDGQIVLEVDGKKLRFPMPDGYRVMKEEDDPEGFANFYKRADRAKDLPLCLVVPIKNKMDAADLLKRRGAIEISRDNVPHRFSENEFINGTKNIKKFYSDLLSGVNEERKKRGIPEVEIQYIRENKRAISVFWQEKTNRNDVDFRVGFSETQVLIKDIILKIRFFDYIYVTDDAKRLIIFTLDYISKLDGI